MQLIHIELREPSVDNRFLTDPVLRATALSDIDGPRFEVRGWSGRITPYYDVLRHTATNHDVLRRTTTYYGVLGRITTYYDVVLRRITMYYDVLRCITTYYDVLRRITT